MKLANIIGKHAIEATKSVGKAGLFAFEFFKHLKEPSLYFKLTLRQAELLGVHSLPIVIITSFFTGAVLALQTYYGFGNKVMADASLGSVVTLSILRELGPVLAGLTISGRVGAAIAAELGTMKVSEQIDALVTLATNPMRYLVVPRVLGCCLMVPVLVVIANVTGIFGGYVVATNMLDFSSFSYLQNSFSSVGFNDIFLGVVKALVFGFIIGITGCYNGMHTKSGAEGVGKSTTTAVVVASVTMLIADYFVTAIMI